MNVFYLKGVNQSMNEVSQVFYSDMDADTTAYLKQKAEETRGLLKRTSEDVIQIGKNLMDAKARLTHGQFIPWVKAELGISQPTAWRFMQVAQGKSFTANDLIDGGSFTPNEHGMGQSKIVTWNTPVEIVAKVEEMFGVIDLDPASNDRLHPNVPARVHYTEDEDGLVQLWNGRVFLNPPYGEAIGQWTEKLVREYKAGNIEEAIVLVPGRTDTQWFQDNLSDYPRCDVRGRLRFIRPECDKEKGAPFPSVIIYLGERIDTFIEKFQDIGPIMQRIA